MQAGEMNAEDTDVHKQHNNAQHCSCHITTLIH